MANHYQGVPPKPKSKKKPPKKKTPKPNQKGRRYA